MSSLLSLGIPVYNQEATIRQTVETALNQQTPFAEVVVSDNWSTDGTARILSEFENRIRVVRPLRHLRMAESWNFCISSLNASWFSLLSGDDLVRPEFAGEMDRAIRENPKAVLIRSDWDVIDQEGKLQYTRRQFSVRRRTKPPRTWLEQLNDPKVSFAAFAARKESWERVRGYPEDFHISQDWIFLLRISSHGEFIRVPKVLASYRSRRRPALEKERLRFRIEDEWRYVTKVLPEIVSVETRLFRKIAGLRLRGALEYASRFEFSAIDAQSKICLREIAEKAESLGKYERWLRYPTAPFTSGPSRYLKKVRTFLRKQVARI